MTAPLIKHALRFPEGSFLITAAHDVYFVHRADPATAYRLRQDKSTELMGKRHVRALTRAADFKTFDLTYEFEDDGKLVAARLISPLGRSKGEAAPAAVIRDINSYIADGLMKLQNFQRPPQVIRAARMDDGRMIVVVEDFPVAGGYDRAVLMGLPGQLKPLAIKSAIQGGNSLFFNTEDGVRISLPYGFGHPPGRENPLYGDQPLAYVAIKDPDDLAVFGLEKPATAAHLDPFCPEARPAPGPNAPAPRGP